MNSIITPARKGYSVKNRKRHTRAKRAASLALFWAGVAIAFSAINLLSRS